MWSIYPNIRHTVDIEIGRMVNNAPYTYEYMVRYDAGHEQNYQKKEARVDGWINLKCAYFMGDDR